MEIYYKSETLRLALSLFIKKKEKIGFVPTMGALHLGHMSLVERALRENDCVVVSIFVNPTQFNNPEDLEKYPKTLENDVALIETLNENVLIYTPNVSDIYKNNISSKKYRFSGLEHEMEGKHREGHFDGVGTVLDKLFRIITPTKAYFGEKDFQQLQVVKKLVEIELLPVSIIGCSIVREKSGLAMSSRNKRLTESQKSEASLINKTLIEVVNKFKTESISELNKYVNDIFNKHPNLALEYFEIANVKTLKTAKRKRKENTYRAFIAVFTGNVRLIDNIALN
ncbi:MAG: pantoate--beta-alanine ligase [Flavobacteriaceae bacterium]|jgi:pantoate--beta-alanine ligase|uniref:pantoate--beta-alanine ligase n=1 Tax=Candidatus Marifrigoribacter sp. Uisw_064 TaxID=3230970 RepID=UPI003AE9EA3C